MRQASVTVSFEQERLKALRFYASKRGAGLEAELAAYLEKLYERFVPPQAREYIELLAQEEAPAPRRAARTEGGGAG